MPASAVCCVYQQQEKENYDMNDAASYVGGARSIWSPKPFRYRPGKEADQGPKGIGQLPDKYEEKPEGKEEFNDCCHVGK